MKRKVTICCAAEVISAGRHSKDPDICKRCKKPVKKLKPIHSGTWTKAY